MRERKPRKKSSYPDEIFLKPVNANEILMSDKEMYGDSCFSHLFDMTTEKCVLCHDNDMCGLLFHKRLKKKVKTFEDQNVTTLDKNDFDGIDVDAIKIWLAAKPRPFKELVAKIDEQANCADKETVKFYAKSLIVDDPRFYPSKGIIHFKK